MFQSFKTFCEISDLITPVRFILVLASLTLFSNTALAASAGSLDPDVACLLAGNCSGPGGVTSGSPGTEPLFADSPCDPNYYDSLEARAWLEAQREITQNQNLIFKPDSVLEYTCFDNHLRELADHAAEMFSETTRWGDDILTVPVPQAEHMDNALNVLVSAALVAYDTNFTHSLLGGRILEWDPVTPPLENDGAITYEFDEVIDPSLPYSCDIMQAVWLKAKCMNFIDNPEEDGFFTFAQYATSEDKRWLPRRCEKDPSTAVWEENVEIALPPIGAEEPWDFDDVVTYLDRFFPVEDPPCGGATSRVRTGLVVADYNRTGSPYFYLENVCYVPGCHWQPAGAGPNADSPASGGECVP